MFKKLFILCLLSIVFFTKSYAQYCLPTFSVSCTSADFIDNVSTTGGIANISNMGTGCNGALPNNYTFFNTMSVSQIQGFNFNVTVQSGTLWSQGFRIWIDWNQDLDFNDLGEDVFVSATSATTPFLATITVPVTALPGPTRMRVMCRFATVPLITDYCSTGNSFGETEDYIMEVIPATPCAGTPVAGSATPATTTVCVNQTVNLGLSGATYAGQQSYQWQQSTNGGASWSNAVGGFGATSPGYLTPPLTTSIMYRMIMICNNSGLADTSNASSITVSGPSYAALPYTQDFENWISFCGTNDVPDDYHWSNTPSSGNNSWRRNDDGVTASWTNITWGAYYPVYSTGLHSARFHSYNTNSTGDIDVYVDCSSQLGTKTLFFDYINDNSAGFGFDYLEVLLSTDGGVTYTPQGTFYGSTMWQNFSLSINSNTPNTIVRFRGHGDYQYDTDLGIDNISVLSPCLGTPNAGVIANVTPCANIPFNLYLTGSTLAGGLIYTWESAPSSTGPWTLVNLTAGPMVNTSIPGTTFFRCIVNCTTSGIDDTTPVQQIDLASFYYCYCQSQSMPTTISQNIGNVKLYNAQNVLILDNGVATPLLNNFSPIFLNSNFTNLTPTNIFPDSTFTFETTCFGQFGFFYNGFSKAYIDFNRDGTYDPLLEVVASGVVNPPLQSMTSPFTVPSNAQFGITGMRVIYEIFGTSSSINPCGTYGDGETEDYLVYISLPPCNTPPNAGFATISDTVTCPGYSVFLQDTTHDVTFMGLTQNWQFSTDGINYSDIPGATLDTITFTVNSTTWFRFRSTCNGVSNGYSNINKVSMSPPYACYGQSQAVGGILDTSDVGAFMIVDNNTNNNIYAFIAGGPHLNNPLAVKKRTDYTTTAILDLYSDSTYKVSFYDIMKGPVHSDARVTMFIDYNNNQVYDIPSERVFSGLADVSNFYLNGTFTTPVTPAVNVATGLRVILNNDLAPNAASDNGVGLYTSGETEDYLVRFKYKQLIPLNVEDTYAIENVGIYPNPTSGILYVGLDTKETTDLDISIMSITGATLNQKHFSKVNGSFVTEFDLAKYAKGIYMIKIASDKGTFVRRAVVE